MQSVLLSDEKGAVREREEQVAKREEELERRQCSLVHSLDSIQPTPSQQTLDLL
jgi:hypothetical protein